MVRLVTRSSRASVAGRGRQALPTAAQLEREHLETEARALEAELEKRLLDAETGTVGAIADLTAVVRRARLQLLGVESDRDVAYAATYLIETSADADTVLVGFTILEPCWPWRDVPELPVWIDAALQDYRDRRAPRRMPRRGTEEYALRQECSRGSKPAPLWLARTWSLLTRIELTAEPFSSYDSNYRSWLKAGPRIARRR